MFTLGFHDVWYHQTVGDAKLFLLSVKQRINDQFLQNWRARLENSSRATFYRCIADFKFQPYLNALNLSKVRTSLSRLRVSSHRLYVETGRWNKPTSIPFDERKCLFCNRLEDEYHFVMECKVLVELRKLLLPAFYWKRPNMFKFIELINTENVSTMKKLGNFVSKAFQLRSEMLYNRS